MERCSALLLARKLQVETAIRYHHTATGMAIIQTIGSADEGVEKLDSSFTAGGNVKWYNNFRK